MRQLAHGFSLPFHLVRVLLDAPRARELYLRVGCTQAAATLGLGLLLFASTSHALTPWSGGFWAALYGALQVAQWGVVALSRDYHDVLGREASLLTQLEPEDEPLVPRVRLNVPWLLTRVRRHVRGSVLFASGLPVIGLVSSVSGESEALFSLLSAAWGFWWLAVFSAGKSARAWEQPEPPAPWYLRGCEKLTPLPLLGGLVRFYASLWNAVSRSIVSPASHVERQPWIFAGLALARLLYALPFARCFLRPLFPVASAHLLAASGGQARGSGLLAS